MRALSLYLIGQTLGNQEVASGFFRKVLYYKNPYTVVSLNNLTDVWNIFNDALYDAFRTNKAIGFETTSHAMNIWDAKFDSKGEVRALYYVDNNDRFTCFNFIMGLKETKVFREGEHIVVEYGENYERGNIKQLILMDLAKDA